MGTSECNVFVKKKNRKIVNPGKYHGALVIATL